MPYYPEEEKSKAYYHNNSYYYKVVSDYARLSFKEIDNIGVFEYWGYLHDAVVWNCNRSEAGQEYLKNAYCYNQTEPDRGALRDMFGGNNGK
ncbi:hypothetical protein [Ruminococcus sp.]|uniref:hypothetical protein n=1 Tax=Ruminococcus sp. TaxID=41978 RepID=UPI001B7219B4|nr:hypothetical protein [Ruminococcus sp.]MBP5431609.1 hypothetical protein [Ruminococcus sp.]